MKRNYIFMSLAIAASGFALSSCEDFLNRPGEDNYNTDIYYLNDEQLYQTANTIYNSPWYDYQRGFFKVGEVMAGNFYWSGSPYQDLVVKSTDDDLRNASASLWSVNAYCNTLLMNVDAKAGSACSQAVINTVKGEALTWKAMAYFFLVRTFGGVPIIHDNNAIINAGTYNDVYRATPADCYDYIVMTLNKAIELLPASNRTGRIDQYCAKALLAKVYLAKAGITGTLNKEELKLAVDLAADVKHNSGRELMENYSDVFRLANNMCSESLIAWRWTAEGSHWTRQNTFQSDLGINQFDEYGACWGGWNGPSVDLIEAFGENPLSATRQNVDARRKATLMMAGDVYDYFWTDRSSTFKKGGFEVCDFFYETDAAILEARSNLSGGGTWQSPTGAQSVKHLVGDDADHVAGIGHSMQSMATSLHTHLLRLADVYLILAEAQALIDGGTTTNAEALDAFNKVHQRSCKADPDVTSVTWDKIWKERRLELALEGDRWYDLVRLSYYDFDKAQNELLNQKRGTYAGLDDVYKAYFESGYASLDADDTKCPYTEGNALTINKSTFILPFPDTDLGLNPHLSEEPVQTDISQFSY